jgi:hypothetical protein
MTDLAGVDFVNLTLGHEDDLVETLYRHAAKSNQNAGRWGILRVRERIFGSNP